MKLLKESLEHYNFPKYVITIDKINYSQNGITHLNLEDFLLGKTK